MSRKIPIAPLRQIIMRIIEGVSDRSIVKDLRAIQLRISRSTVAIIRKKVLNSIQTKFEYNSLDDQDIDELIYGTKLATANSKVSPLKKTILEQIEYIEDQIKLPGVSLNLLWIEFLNENFERLHCSYSTYCRITSPHLSKTEISYHNQKPLPGSVLMIDFAGKKLFYKDKNTGELVGCVVFVAILGNSGYSMVEILPDARTEYVIQALTNCLHAINGSPLSLLTDNMRQLVKKASRYEPEFTDAAIAWANHYNIHLSATRIISPKDKALIERLVRIVYQRIHAPLRHFTFFSLEELRIAVAEKVRTHNAHKFSGKSYSRLDAFTADEASALNPLPESDFVMQNVTRAKVQKTYHVYLGEDKNYYSVPYELIGKNVDIKYNLQVVEIYDNMDLVATHTRSLREGYYTTNESHMPESHKAYKDVQGYTKQDFLERASKFGPYTKLQIEYLIDSKRYPQHAFKGCLGLLSLGFPKKYGRDRLENACELGCHIGKYGMREIEKLLANGEDITFNESKNAGKSKPQAPKGDNGTTDGNIGTLKEGKEDHNDDGHKFDDESLRGPEDFVL